MKLYFEDIQVGEIKIPTEAAPYFEYAADWLTLADAFPVSSRMPLNQERHEWATLGPWLINLLPENSDDIRAMARNLDVPSEDVLAILERVGRDTSGAISFAQRGERGADVIAIDGQDDLARIIEELPAKPFLAGDEGVSMSLAGVQTKLAVRVFEDGRLGIPINGAASSHILKPDSARLNGGVQNEAFCLTLAQLCGIDAPEVTTGRAGTRAYLLVTRYDRVLDGRQLRRSHQEDFCQALGYPPSAKYQHGSGYRGKKVKFREMMERLRMLNPLEAEKLWDRMVFNVLCCNTDAHAKNYSIHIFGDAFELAPIYDVMCADAWPNITPYLAFDVDSQRKWRDIEGRNWAREAVACGFAGRFGPASAEAMATTIIGNLNEAVERVRQMPAGDHALLSEFRDAVERCCRHTLSVMKRYDGRF
ncbi:HipA domain-containing protein [Paracoccus hibiscisoli]|uniref:Type II toxin-antitoxin system HipA family toxin n=1 Tax=Paracoccus hibiscisoli TaxID=2023261 RepID=A0A4U0QA11_9RHOB|nr:HipA domain-containing protein [Paracoccus hibiscisoli]TJZ78173.1 type II toxin-antitoxin system HipA family toxin [Paracoccus hibiscisoli]